VEDEIGSPLDHAGRVFARGRSQPFDRAEQLRAQMIGPAARLAVRLGQPGRQGVRLERGEIVEIGQRVADQLGEFSAVYHVFSSQRSAISGQLLP